MIITYDDWIGFTGTITLITAYICSSINLHDAPKTIDLFNIYGSVAVGFNCIIKKTYPPLLLEILWLIVALKSLHYNIYNNHKPINNKQEIGLSKTYQEI